VGACGFPVARLLQKLSPKAKPRWMDVFRQAIRLPEKLKLIMDTDVDKLTALFEEQGRCEKTLKKLIGCLGKELKQRRPKPKDRLMKKSTVTMGKRKRILELLWSLRFSKHKLRNLWITGLLPLHKGRVKEDNADKCVPGKRQNVARKSREDYGLSQSEDSKDN
jgi:electron transport complex protein RnfB